MGSLNENGGRISQSRKSTKSLGSAFVFNIDRQEVETFLDRTILPSGSISIEDNQLHSTQLGGMVKTQTSVADTGVDRNFEGTSFTPVGQDLTFVEIRNDGGAGGTIIITSGTTTIISSGTTIISGAVTNIYGDVTVVSGTTTNILGDTTIVSGTTTNIYGGNTYISGDNIVNIGTTSSSGTIIIATSGTDQWEFDSEGNFVTLASGNYILASKRVLNYPQSTGTISPLDSRTVYTNANNAPGLGMSTRLPQAQKGLEYTFIGYAAAGTGILISTYHPTDKIVVSTATAGGAGATNPNIWASGAGASVTLLCIGVETNNASGVWVATSMMGNWTTADN